jgi:outer membrane protein assembly factor BamB
MHSRVSRRTALAAIGSAALAGCAGRTSEYDTTPTELPDGEWWTLNHRPSNNRYVDSVELSDDTFSFEQVLSTDTDILALLSLDDATVIKQRERLSMFDNEWDEPQWVVDSERGNVAADGETIFDATVESVRAIDSMSGEIGWEIDSELSVEEDNFVYTVTTTGDLLLVGSSVGVSIYVKDSGEQVGNFGNRLDPFRSQNSLSFAEDGTLYVPYDGGLSILDLERSGDLTETNGIDDLYDLPQAPIPTPEGVIVAGRERTSVVSQNESAGIYYISDGSVIWRRSLRRNMGLLVVTDKHIYVYGSNAESSRLSESGYRHTTVDGGSFYSLKLTSGETKWETPLDFASGSPLVTEEHTIAYGQINGDQEVCMLIDRDNGDKISRENISRGEEYVVCASSNSILLSSKNSLFEAPL